MYGALSRGGAAASRVTTATAAAVAAASAVITAVVLVAAATIVGWRCGHGDRRRLGLALRIGLGLALRFGGTRRCLLGLALHPLVGLAGAALLLLLDQPAELALGVAAGLLVLGLLGLGRLLGLLDLGGRGRGLVLAILEHAALLVEIGDRLVQLIGRGIAGAQRRHGPAGRVAGPRCMPTSR